MDIIKANGIGAIEMLLAIAGTYGHADDEMIAIRKQLENELSDAGKGRDIFIGSINSKAVAMIQIIYDNVENDPELADGHNIAHIHNLQVRSELQRQGIGINMMTFVEEIAGNKGFSVLTLGVDDINTGAIKSVSYTHLRAHET